MNACKWPDGLKYSAMTLHNCGVAETNVYDSHLKVGSREVLAELRAINFPAESSASTTAIVGKYSGRCSE